MQTKPLSQISLTEVNSSHGFKSCLVKTKKLKSNKKLRTPWSNFEECLTEAYMKTRYISPLKWISVGTDFITCYAYSC